MKNIREDFPIFLNTRIVYLDSAATTQKPKSVIEAIQKQYEFCNGNVHRSPHKMGRQTTDAYEKARQNMLHFFGALEKYEAVFTRGTTEGINLAAASFLQRFKGMDREVMVTIAEHHSNFVPWQQWCERLGLKLRVVGITKEGTLDLESFHKLLSKKTVLVAMAHMTNTFGIIHPVSEIIKKAHEAGAKVLLDGAQAAGHIPVKLEELDCDFYAISGHKMYGPNGIGVLFGKKELLDRMEPWQYGGEMIEAVTIEKTCFQKAPYKFEAGTPDYVGAIGLSAALDYLQGIGGMEEIKKQEERLFEILVHSLADINAVELPVQPELSVGILSFKIREMHTFDAAVLFDTQNIALRSGMHCAQPLMKQYGFEDGTIRASIGIYSTPADIERFVSTLKKITELTH